MSSRCTAARLSNNTPRLRVRRQFVYANDQYNIVGQWCVLPKLFKDSHNAGYEIIMNDRDLIQFKNEQSWTVAANTQDGGNQQIGVVRLLVDSDIHSN